MISQSASRPSQSERWHPTFPDPIYSIDQHLMIKIHPAQLQLRVKNCSWNTLTAEWTYTMHDTGIFPSKVYMDIPESALKPI